LKPSQGVGIALLAMTLLGDIQMPPARSVGRQLVSPRLGNPVCSGACAPSWLVACCVCSKLAHWPPMLRRVTAASTAGVQPKVCPECGREFTPSRRGQVTCGIECGVARTAFVRRLPDRVCLGPLCGRTFRPKRASQRYCTVECADDARRVAARELTAEANRVPIKG
jgi:hypothetical protein